MSGQPPTDVPAGDGLHGAPPHPAPAGTTTERWRPIPGHKGYEASSHGRVRSVPRVLSDGRQAGGLVLTPTLDKDCYWRVKLGRRTVPVHVAVALAFHGRPEVRHLNGDQRDNTPGNLAWGSHRENERDKWKQKETGRWNRTHPSGITTVSRTSVRLSEAVAQEIVSGSLAALRKSRQRDPAFPAPVAMDGLAPLYDPAQLILWDRQRRGLA